MKISACIFARGGSKGLQSKNILEFGGRPLIAWAIEQGLALKNVDQVFVSTDSIEIADIARQHGAVVPFIRPASLATDDSPEWLAWRHMLAFQENESGCLPDVLLSIPTTAPLRLTSDIQQCLDVYELGDVDAVVTVTDARRSPFFNMLKINNQGYANLVITNDSVIARRQDSPIVYDMTTVAYVLDTRFVLERNGIFEGRVKAVHVPPERAIDIDNILDYEIAKFLLLQKMNCSE